MIIDLGDIWQETKSALERMYDVWAPGHDAVPGPMFRLYGPDGQAHRCEICDRDDRWQLEREEPLVFVCEHEPITAGHWGIRQFDDRAERVIARIEVASDPMGFTDGD
jgi:hypothetical protein